MPPAVYVSGLRELQRAFAQIDTGLKAELTREIALAAGPAQYRAESLAVANIRNIGLLWSSMRLGVSAGLVYLAPAMRRRGGSPRPNLAPLLMNRAMLPGVEETMPEIEQRLDGWLDQLGAAAGF